MEIKGKFPCHSPVCSVFAGDLGHAQRRSWTSILGCLASICSRAPRARRRRRPLIITPCTIPGRPRAHIRTKVLLRHILEMPLLGRVGIDLHLGQKPKLGGMYDDNSLIIHQILSGLCISMFRFLSFSLLFLFCFYFPKHKRPKILQLFLFVCFFSFLVLVCFTF
jgi:hypothetical protein